MWIPLYAEKAMKTSCTKGILTPIGRVVGLRRLTRDFDSDKMRLKGASEQKEKSKGTKVARLI
jgi:hypothetical protein